MKIDQKKIADQLIRHEGLRLKPYHCPAGKLTIGVGRNLEDKGITEKEAILLLEYDEKRQSVAGGQAFLIVVIGAKVLKKYCKHAKVIL